MLPCFQIAGDTVFVNGDFKIPAAEQTGASQVAIANSTTGAEGVSAGEQQTPHAQQGQREGGTGSTYDELVKAQLAMETNGGSTQAQPSQSNAAPSNQQSQLNQKRFHRSNRERYATQAERLREAVRLCIL